MKTAYLEWDGVLAKPYTNTLYPQAENLIDALLLAGVQVNILIIRSGLSQLDEITKLNISDSIKKSIIWVEKTGNYQEETSAVIGNEKVLFATAEFGRAKYLRTKFKSSSGNFKAIVLPSEDKTSDHDRDEKHYAEIKMAFGIKMMPKKTIPERKNYLKKPSQKEKNYLRHLLIYSHFRLNL